MESLEELRAEEVSAQRWEAARKIGFGLILFALVTGMITLGLRDYFQTRTVNELGSALDAQRYQFEECQKDEEDRDPKVECDEPVSPKADEVVEQVPGPPGPIGPEGPEGDPGQPGKPGEDAPPVTVGAIRAAVSLFCTEERCGGKRPTASQVAAAVSIYCDSRGECQGPTGAVGPEGPVGEQGEPGKPGENGTPGKDGQNATPEMIAKAVADYCTDGRCKGEKGDKGEPGADSTVPGPEGPQGPAGTSAFPFVFQFTTSLIDLPGDANDIPAKTYTCTITEPGVTFQCV